MNNSQSSKRKEKPSFVRVQQTDAAPALLWGLRFVSVFEAQNTLCFTATEILRRTTITWCSWTFSKQRMKEQRNYSHRESQKNQKEEPKKELMYRPCNMKLRWRKTDVFLMHLLSSGSLMLESCFTSESHEIIIRLIQSASTTRSQKEIEPVFSRGFQ